MTAPTVKSRIITYIHSSPRHAFRCRDFARFAGYRQIKVALAELLATGVLVQVGYDVYEKAQAML